MVVLTLLDPTVPLSCDESIAMESPTCALFKVLLSPLYRIVLNDDHTHNNHSTVANTMREFESKKGCVIIRAAVISWTVSAANS
jgi:hypothetical protein